jgi:hypothetical protein
MADKATHKAGKRQGGGGKRKTGQTRRTEGRIQVRRDTAEYRAAAQEQATRVRAEIDTALADALRVRQEIEARIENQWHNPPAGRTTEAEGAGRRRRAKA